MKQPVVPSALDVEYWRERSHWTDVQFVAEICAMQRRFAEQQLKRAEEAAAAERDNRDSGLCEGASPASGLT